MSSLSYAIWAFAAGALIPLMALLNAGIARTVGGQIQATVTAQLITAALIDHFALAGAALRPVTLMRATGLLIVVTGVVITQLSDRQGGAPHASAN